MRARVVLGLIIVMIAAGCSRAPSPATTPTIATAPERTNISYAGDDQPEHLLDMYLPGKDGGKGVTPYPTVVFVHGGGWGYGDKSVLNDDAELRLSTLRDLLLDNGYAIASVNYRLTPKATYPQPLQDVAAAVRFLKQQAGRYGLDRDRFVMLGESAGAHLGAMTAMTTGESIQSGVGVGEQDAKVKAIVGYYGLYDLARRTQDQQSGPCQGGRGGEDSSHGRLIGADPATPEGQRLAAAASPLNQVRRTTPPVLLFHGSRDCTTPPAQAERFKAALTTAGVPVQLTIIDAPHGDPRFFTTPELNSRLLAFLTRYVRG